MSPGQDEGWTSGNLADRMTAADHANTIREALTGRPGVSRSEIPHHDALAALNALQAQAEAVKPLTDDWEQYGAEQFKRAEAAEAERDRALDREAGTQDALDAIRAERDRRIDPDVHAAEIGWDGATTALQRCEDERDRLADALRRIKRASHSNEVREMVDAALAQTEQPCDGSNECPASTHLHGCYSEQP